MLPFNLSKGLYLECRNVLLPWWEIKDFEQLRQIGNPQITTGGNGSSAYGSCDKLLWEGDCIFDGIPVSIEVQDYIVKNYYRIHPAGRYGWSEGEYPTLKKVLAGKFGSSFLEKRGENGLLDIAWKFGDVNIGLSMQEHFGVFTNFVVRKDAYMRNRP